MSRTVAPFVRTRWALACLAPWLLCLVGGCASDLVRFDGRYHHPRHQFSIAAPSGDGAPWQRVAIEGSWLAFRRPGPQTMSLQSRCGQPVAHPAILARTLVLGIRDRRLLQAGPIIVLGRNGWSQTFDTRMGGRPVRVKTVTVAIDRCIWDWSLVAAADFAAAERVFDRWWGTFRLDSQDGGGEDES